MTPPCLPDRYQVVSFLRSELSSYSHVAEIRSQVSSKGFRTLSAIWPPFFLASFPTTLLSFTLVQAPRPCVVSQTSQAYSCLKALLFPPPGPPLSWCPHDVPPAPFSCLLKCSWSLSSQPQWALRPATSSYLSLPTLLFLYYTCHLLLHNTSYWLTCGLSVSPH